MLHFQYDQETERRVLQKEAKEDGFAEGEIKGKIEGREEGASQKATEVAKNLLHMNLTLEQITQATGLSSDVVEALKEEM